MAERISSFVFNFNDDDEQTLLFIKVYFVTIMREWIGIDKWRMDKFLFVRPIKKHLLPYLIQFQLFTSHIFKGMRCMLNKSFSYLKHKKWNKELTDKFLKIIYDFPLNINDDTCPDGVCYHLSDIYLEELGKFGDSLKPAKAVKMLSVFVKSLASCTK